VGKKIFKGLGKLVGVGKKKKAELPTGTYEPKVDALTQGDVGYVKSTRRKRQPMESTLISEKLGS